MASRRQSKSKGDDAPESTRAATPQLALELAESAGVITTLAPGRLSRDFPQEFPVLPVILPPQSAESSWQFFQADESTLRRFPINTILDWLADLSPDVSKALWDLCRICNSGWEVKAYHVDSAQPFPTAQRSVDAFHEHLGNMYGSVDRLWNELFIQAFMRGAMASELVLDETASLPIDFGLPDPDSFRFKRELDPVRGPVWVLGQFQFGNAYLGQVNGFVPMARPTIRYVPIDPMPGRPYGRPMVAPALFPTLFLLTLLHDLRRVIGQQGYPRIAIKVDLAALQGLMPAETRMSPDKAKAWIKNTMDDIKKEYAQLEPDDAYIHTSAIEVSGPLGTVDASSLGGITAIIQVLERQSVRAVKSVPLLMSLTDGSSEANANRQWEVEVSGVTSLQKLAASMIGAQEQLALRAQGIQARVVVTFAQLRATQALRDAQTQQIRVMVEAMKYDRGWTSQDEASMAVTGHPADQPEPRVLPVTDQPQPGEGLGGIAPPPDQPATGTPEPTGDGSDRGWQPVVIGNRDEAELAVV